MITDSQKGKRKNADEKMKTEKIEKKRKRNLIFQFQTTKSDY